VYELRTPHAALTAYIANYWFVTSTPHEPVDLRVDVFVDGCSDLVFNFGVAYQREVIGGPTRWLASSNLDAQRLDPIRIVQRGLVLTSGVRFRLGGLGAFVPTSLHELTNTTLAPERVLGPAAAALEHALRSEPDLDAQAGMLDAFFLAALQRPPSFLAFERALAACVASDGSASVGELASNSDMSPRQLERLFARHLGLGPKLLGRILRFQHALRALMRDPGTTLAEVATQVGYFDQAHFIKDFRRFSGGVPRGYRGYYPAAGPDDFAPNVVVFLQDGDPPLGLDA
jgi:AraC-like DNA-binding protein